MIAADTTPVGIAYSAFAPAQVQILTGDTVTWHNGSTREHTVVGDDYASPGKIPPRGDYTHTFTTAGPHAYVCTLHLGMRGEVDVEPMLLDAPAGPVVRGQPFMLMGRAQAGVGEVTLERDTGRGFIAVGHTRVGPDGKFHATFPPAPSSAVRGTAGALASPPVSIVVRGQQVRLTVSRRGGKVVVRVASLPVRPRATVVLQFKLRERFGWWPLRTHRLDARGRTTFTIPVGRPVAARIVLTGRDGTTPLAASRPLRIP